MSKGILSGTTIGIFIVLIFYLVGLGLLFASVGQTINLQANYSQFPINMESGIININDCFCGTITCVEYGSIYGTENRSGFAELMDRPSLAELCGETNTGFFANLMTGINDMPVWLNILFFSIPFALLIFIGVLLVIHGG